MTDALIPAHAGAPLTARRSDCIHGAVGVLARADRLLLIQRSAHVRAPGMWCFPGGAVETGETPAEAVVREYREEVGLHVWAERKVWSWLRDDGGLYLEWWLVHHVGGEMVLNADEVADAAWMTDDQIHTHPQMIPNNRWFIDYFRGNGAAS